MKTSRLQRQSTTGFTMMELLIVITIMAILAGMVAMTATAMNRNAREKKAKVQIETMAMGLEKYKRDYGEYPNSMGNSQKQFDGGSYNVAGARMLYQALTGDGSDAIQGVGGRPSNGEMGEEGDGEVYLGLLTAANKSQNMVFSEGSDYFLVDPFGKPYQYFKAGEGRPTNNVTYDLWSFGHKEAAPGFNPEDHPNVWIHNW